jgi:hypothetical protein
LIGVKSAARVLPQWAEHVLFQQWLSGSHHVFRGREASSRHHGGQVRHSLSGSRTPLEKNFKGFQLLSYKGYVIISKKTDDYPARN